MAAALRRTTRAKSDAAAPIFAALGDPVRLALVARLCDDGPLPTIQLKESSGVTRQAVTKHLQVLENIGLVRSDRVGKDRLWQIESKQLAEARAFIDRISAQWDARLQRLRLLVEDDN
jgi:DNA-binding transcriptional ArsR family regulator